MGGCRFPDLKEQSRSVAAGIGNGGTRSRAFAIPKSVDGGGRMRRHVGKAQGECVT